MKGGPKCRATYFKTIFVNRIKDPDLQYMLAALRGYCGLPPSTLSPFYYANATGGYLEKGAYYIKERSQDPGDAIAQVIEVEEAASPLTNRSFTGNPGGAIYGFEQSMDNAFMNRIENTTPVKGLYLASAWGNPGGGYSVVLRGGQSAFVAMMKDWGG